MGCTVNNFTFVGILQSIMYIIEDIRSSNGGLVGDRNGNNQTDCRCYENLR